MCCCNEKNPVGTVNYFARQFPPEGWLLCDGREVSRDVFADLYNMVGTSFGTGDGKSTFNLPDLRGEFIRGLDEGRGIDKGRMLGSNQKGSLVVTDPSITHNVIGSFINSDDNEGLMNQRVGLDEPENISDYTGLNNAGVEIGFNQSVVSNQIGFDFGVSRPRNVALLACIKY
ncbi:MAG: putative phage tail fiber protein [Firmicutes bacterium]|nr:putative phage tail fiber protein [Bacillota bacterium]